MAPQNRALWLKAKQDPIMVVDVAPYTKPDADEVVIKVHAVAINPADPFVQRVGILVTQFPAIIGCDAAGVVEEVGPNVTRFKPGDRVLGACSCLRTKDGVYCYSAFQQYVVLKTWSTAKVLDGVAFHDATVLPLAVVTAASCLFLPGTLQLEMPPSSKGKGKTLLVWGASSSVGSCGIQLAVAAGYEVVGVASRHNHAFVKSIGATECFDQKDLSLVNDMIGFLKGKDVVGAYDAISKEGTLHTLCDVLAAGDGAKLICGVMPGAEAFATNGVKIVTNFGAVQSFESKVGPHIWHTFLEPALAAGKFQYKPDPVIVGQGLESIQKACDLLAEGVSAKKLVVTL